MEKEIQTYAHARAGLVGNPSDGYFGKTIALAVRNYKAGVSFRESRDLVIEPSEQDISRFKSVDALIDDVRRHGYYGGVRLIKATIRQFGTYCREHGHALDRRNFTVRYHSDIPRLVGMAGSSAIITATMRALMAFYGVDIPKPRLAALILSVERDELGLAAGLQDRVIQVYGGVVYMDFDQALMQQQGHGRYVELAPGLLPPLYMAFDTERAQGSEQFHSHVRAQHEAGDAKVVRTMREIAELADAVRVLLEQGRGREIAPLLNRNFDLRASIYEISSENLAMVRTARETGASAKFAGSGGTIIGTYEGEAMYAELVRILGAQGCKVFKPEIL